MEPSNKETIEQWNQRSREPSNKETMKQGTIEQGIQKNTNNGIREQPKKKEIRKPWKKGTRKIKNQGNLLI